MLEASHMSHDKLRSEDIGHVTRGLIVTTCVIMVDASNVSHDKLGNEDVAV